MVNLTNLDETYKKLVDDDADLIGKIAFGLFVRARTEVLGRDIAVVDFSITPSERQVFRSAATQEVDGVQEATLENAYDDMKADVLSEMLGGVDRKVEEIRISTHWARTVAFNLVAWIISIALTIVIAKSLTTPSAQDHLLNAIETPQSGQQAPQEP